MRVLRLPSPLVFSVPLKPILMGWLGVMVSPSATVIHEPLSLVSWFFTPNKSWQVAFTPRAPAQMSGLITVSLKSPGTTNGGVVSALFAAANENMNELKYWAH